MEASFGGIQSMLSGKKYPQNVRALRIVLEEMLDDIVQQEHICNHYDLMKYLEDQAAESLTTRLRVDNFVKPVFLMMKYV